MGWELSDKIIILTGATRVGRIVAKKLAERKAHLAISYFSSKQPAEEIRKECRSLGIRCEIYQADVSVSGDVEKLVEQIKKDFGRIDGLVHMAATYISTPWESLSVEDWDKSLDAIAKSAFLISKRVGDELLKNEGEIRGKIITISDWSVLRAPYKDYLAYNVAKSAVEGLTLSLAKELAPYVTVNCIAPGPILRPANLTDEENEEVASKTLLRPWGGPEEIARAVEFFMDSNFTTGVILPVDGGRSIA